MAWLNEPVEIIENSRSSVEKSTYDDAHYVGQPFVRHTRTRTNILDKLRYVGCHYEGAKAKEALLKSAPATYSEVDTVASGGGQFQVVATRYTEGEWSPWTIETIGGA